MYALKVEEYFSGYLTERSVQGISAQGISESNNDSYQPSLDNVEESDDQLADQITTLAGQINAANYRFLKLIAEFDRRKAWAGFGIRSCAHWLSWKCGLDMGTAREKVRVARALEGLPGINAGFEKGELSFSKVRAMTRVATETNESFLLNIAEYGTAQHMEKLVQGFRTVSRIEKFDADTINEADLNISEKQRELNLQQRQQEARKVSCYQDDDGMWIIHAKLPAEEGGLVAKVLQELGDRITDSEESPDTASAIKGDIVNDEALQNSATSVAAETEMEIFSLNKEEEKLTYPQRRADALVAIAEHYLASDSVELSSLKGAERCQLVMHVRADSHIAGANNDTSLDGRWLLPNAARRLACDASLLVVQEDEVGNVLDIGRKTRIIPPAMTRALAIRDGGCQFQGCCETRYTEGHHIKHWADGGETKLDNLVTLCRYHHRELHKGSFFLSLKPVSTNTEPQPPIRFAERLCFSKVDRYFDAPFNRTEASLSNKSVIAANPAKFTCACCEPSDLSKTLPRLIYNSIDEKTAVTKWAGESMDIGIAIDGLLSAGNRWKNGLN